MEGGVQDHTQPQVPELLGAVRVPTRHRQEPRALQAELPQRAAPGVASHANAPSPANAGGDSRDGLWPRVMVGVDPPELN